MNFVFSTMSRHICPMITNNQQLSYLTKFGDMFDF